MNSFARLSAASNERPSVDAKCSGNALDLVGQREFLLFLRQLFLGLPSMLLHRVAQNAPGAWWLCGWVSARGRREHWRERESCLLERPRLCLGSSVDDKLCGAPQGAHCTSILPQLRVSSEWGPSHCRRRARILRGQETRTRRGSGAERLASVAPIQLSKSSATVLHDADWLARASAEGMEACLRMLRKRQFEEAGEFQRFSCRHGSFQQSASTSAGVTNQGSWHGHPTWSVVSYQNEAGRGLHPNVAPESVCLWPCCLKH